MKKILPVFLAFLIIASFSGCSPEQKFTAEIIKNGECVLTASDTEALKAYRDGNQPLFKDVSIKESKSLFYNSYTFHAVTNIQECNDKFEIKITMPGKIVQSTGGETSGSLIRFQLTDLTQEKELAVYSDSNNNAVTFIIVGILIAIFAGFLLYLKKAQG